MSVMGAGQRDDMNDTQSTLLTMYEDIRKILESNGITFYIHFGTAIGALRHNGFIPWDDDIDLAVWEEDLDKVNRILSEQLDKERYYYHVPSADTHPHVIAKSDDFKNDLQMRKLPFIDIFPISKYPSEKIRQALCNAFIWGNVCSIWVIDHVDSIHIHKMISWIPNVFKHLADMIVNKDSDLTVIYATEFKDYIFKRETYGNPVMHVFETTNAPLPERYDEMLSSIYGDYMTPPPESERKGAGGFPCGAYKDYIMKKQRKE